MANHDDETQGRNPDHQVVACLGRVREQIAVLADRPLYSLDPAAAREALVQVSALASQVAALELALAAHGHTVEVGADSGASSTGAWWAVTTRQNRPAAIAKVHLARSLESTWTRVRGALTRGDLNAEQARVIVAALEDLPDDLDSELIDGAEAHLVTLAADHDPRELRILGSHILTVIAPEIGEERDRKRLEAAEAKAAQKCRLTLSRDGHGSVHGRFTVPEVIGAMLEKALDAIAAPQHRNSPTGGDGAGSYAPGRPSSQRLGEAFCELLETLPADKLPKTGGVSATVVVTIDFEALKTGHGTAWLDTGQPLSAGEARRLACEAGIIPAVLGTDSAILDVGLASRLFDFYQRQYLAQRDKGCTAAGCDWPPARCHAHHDHPWHLGGKTDVANGRLLCPHHHARAHDPAYAVTVGADNKVAFHRRT